MLRIDTLGAAGFCLGDSGTLKVRNTGQNLLYEWFRNGIKLLNDSDSLVVKQASIYQVRIVDSNQCAAIDSVGIVTFTLPDASILSPSQTTFCDNDSIELNALNSSYTNYKWMRNNTLISTGPLPAYFAKLAGNYSLEVVDSNFCSSISTSIKLTTKESPVISLDPFGITEKCEGDSLDFVILGGKPSYTYTWIRGSDTLLKDVSSSSLNVSLSGRYKVLARDTNACISYSSLSEFTLLQNPEKPILNINPDGLSSTQANRYQWLLSGVELSNETQQNIVSKKPGYYQVMVWNSSGCFNMSDSLYFIPINEKNLGEKLSTSVYPNPSTGYYNLYIHSTENGLAEARVYNELSEEIMTVQLRLTNGVNQYAIDLRDLAIGTYALRVRLDDEMHVFKLILTR
jgi:hypothetical protein